MTRIDNLPENQLIARTQKILQEIENLKSRQFIGADSLKIINNISNNTWDINDSVNSFTQAFWRVTFAPNNVATTYTELQYEFEVVGNSSEFIYIDTYPAPNTITSGIGSDYILEYTNFFNPTTLRVKFAVKSADTGTITLTRLPDVT